LQVDKKRTKSTRGNRKGAEKAADLTLWNDGKRKKRGAEKIAGVGKKHEIKIEKKKKQSASMTQKQKPE